ncbi:MAG: hypothetical protein QXV24_04005 [Nitrososphaerota archaeon]
MSQVCWMQMQKVLLVSSWTLEDSWKFAGNNWGIGLHRLCSRTGSFPPSLAYYFVEKYSSPGEVVFDPFSGKGTAPLEACRSGRIGIGNDLAPEAYVITHAKVRPVPTTEVVKWAKKNRYFVENYRKNDAPEEVEIFFSKYTLRQLLAVRELLMDDDSDLGLFVKAVLLGILHGSSTLSLSVKCSHSFSMAPRYVERSIHRLGLKKPRRNVLDCIVRRALTLMDGYAPPIRGAAFMRDARQTGLREESVDLIITSPPYFNMQTYAWDNWLRLWFLGYDYKEIAKRLFHTGSIERFREFIREALREMYRVLKWDKPCFMVLGIVRLRGERINMADIVAPIAEEVGFTPVRIIMDNIPRENKYLMYLREDQGVSREVILELHKGEAVERDVSIDWGRGVALEKRVVIA